MINLPPDQNEAFRIDALKRYRDLNYANSPEFKNITQLAADICEVGIALVSFVDVEDVKIRFTCGLEGVDSVPRDISFCQHTVSIGETFIVEDTLKDERFKNSPYVVGGPKFRFYTGMPITTNDGYVIGALCVLDTSPKKLNNFQLDALDKLSLIISKSLESKHTEYEKFKEESRYRTIYNNAPICIHEIDLQGNFSSMNPSGLALLGLEQEEKVRGIKYLSVVSDEDFNRIKSLLNDALNGNQSTFEFKGACGQYYSSCFIPIFNDQNEVIKLMGISEIITKRKKAELDLRETNLALTHSLPGVARLNPDGNYTHVNNMYARLLGYTPEELVGKSWKVTVDPDHIETGIQGYQRMLKEDNVEFDIQGIHKDGSPIYKHVLISKRVNSNGDFIGHLCCMKDITDKVESERKHKELQNELNHVARLSNMNQMATGLAHELNQPLSAISNYSDAAQTLLNNTPKKDEKLVEFLKGISAQALRAGEIIRHCRQFADKANKKDIANINEIASETTRFLNSDIVDNNVTLRTSLEKDLPLIEVDKVQIQQVLVNLIRNGIEAMSNNNGTNRNLTVCTKFNKENGAAKNIQVTIKDTGSGVANCNFDKLFEPFFTTKKDGMGMGLSISRTIIETHGGKLWATCENNCKEMLLHFTLPVNTD